MNISFSPTGCPNASLSDALSIAKKAGFSRVELLREETESTPVHNDLSVRMVRDQLESAGIELSAPNIRSDREKSRFGREKSAVQPATVGVGHPSRQGDRNKIHQRQGRRPVGRGSGGPDRRRQQLAGADSGCPRVPSHATFRVGHGYRVRLLRSGSERKEEPPGQGDRGGHHPWGAAIPSAPNMSATGSLAGRKTGSRVRPS